MAELKSYKGRAAKSNEVSRYDDWQREDFVDGWYQQSEGKLKTTLTLDKSTSILTSNNSPDVPFRYSINPYRGCEHGCIYCYARPSHAWLGFSPGLDFESQIIYKADAAALLRKKFQSSRYECDVIALGSNTDAYQPVEKKLQITRELLKVFLEYQHPLGVITKSSLIERDIDLLRGLAEKNLVNVLISLTTLDKELARKMEPRAASPLRRLKTIEKLRAAGINCGVLIAPVIPVLTDHEMEDLLYSAKEAGAMFAGKVLLRLPMETQELFSHWVENEFPDKSVHILNRVKDCHGGALYKSNFGERMTGSGHIAEMISQRFQVAMRKLEFSASAPSLNCENFQVPGKVEQLSLF